MTTDPRDAEIARLRMALAESEAAAEGALMILVQTKAERDAALAQVAGAYEAAAQAIQPTGEPSYHLDLRAIRQQYAAAIRALTPADALAALSRRYAKMRAEELMSLQDDVQDIRKEASGRADGVRFMALDDVRQMIAKRLDAILAAAEKEAGNG